MINRIINRVKKEFYRPGPYEKLRTSPRYTKGNIEVNGLDLYFPDAVSFLFTYEEIFKQGIYKFKTAKEKPYIIDCGANIGISTLYFHLAYPGAEILAFEPDQMIFEYLEKNISQLKGGNVTLIKKGLWKDEGMLSFCSEGADAGRIAESNLGALSIEEKKVEVTRLSNYIDREVDFVKLDIEGAEMEVLEELAPKLKFIRNIFIEYHSFVGKDQCLDKLLNILTEGGFRYYVYAPSPLRVHPFMDDQSFLSIDCLLSICAQRV